MKQPRQWSSQELAEASRRATEIFRKERLQEPLEDYLEAFDRYLGNVEHLFETTIDLTELDESAVRFLADRYFLEVFRYLAGPPISDDDLKTVAEVQSLNASQLRDDPEAVARIVEVVRLGLDRRRFPWVREEREPTEDERYAAVLASAAIMATQRVSTNRRSKGRLAQEAMVSGVLTRAGFSEVAKRKVMTLTDAPEPGQFCGECLLGSGKADFLVRLWDSRLMPIECKVSNSAINSVKRLNREAAAKASAWINDFGRLQVVPAVVLSGVYKLHNLEDAQERGLVIHWAHDMKTLTDWIETTRP